MYLRPTPNMCTWSASAKLASIFSVFSFVIVLLLCTHKRFFLCRILLIGSGKLLSIKNKCHCRFVVMYVGFIMNCQNKSRSQSLPVPSARHSPVDYLHATTHTVSLAGTFTLLILFTMKFTSRHARGYGRT